MFSHPAINDRGQRTNRLDIKSIWRYGQKKGIALQEKSASKCT